MSKYDNSWMDDVMEFVRTVWDGSKLIYKILAIAVFASVDVILTGYVFTWTFESINNIMVLWLLSYGLGAGISGVSIYLIDRVRGKTIAHSQAVVFLIIALQIADVVITSSIMELAPAGSGDPNNFLMPGFRSRPYIWWLQTFTIAVFDGFGEYIVESMLESFDPPKPKPKKKKTGGGGGSKVTVPRTPTARKPTVSAPRKPSAMPSYPVPKKTNIPSDPFGGGRL